MDQFAEAFESETGRTAGLGPGITQEPPCLGALAAGLERQHPEFGNWLTREKLPVRQQIRRAEPKEHVRHGLRCCRKAPCDIVSKREAADPHYSPGLQPRILQN